MERRGGFWIRLGARIVDGLLMGAVVYLLIILFTLDTQSAAVQAGESLLMNLYFVLVPVLWAGHTVGKWLLGIRIVRDDGSEVNLLTMVIREFLVGLLYGVTLGIGVIVSAFMIALREDKKSIHDLIAKTKVVYGRV